MGDASEKAFRYLHGHRRWSVQSSAAEIHAEACAPDLNRPILIQVGVGGNVVILVADIAFHRTEIDEARLFDRVVAFFHLGRDQIDMDVGTIGSRKFAQT